MSIESKKNEIFSINKLGYGYIKSIKVSREINNGEASSFDASISFSRIDGESITVSAKRCASVSIGDINNMLFASIEFVDISSRQLEGSKYMLFDSENDLFQIKCMDFEVHNGG